MSGLQPRFVRAMISKRKPVRFRPIIFAVIGVCLGACHDLLIPAPISLPSAPPADAASLADVGSVVPSDLPVPELNDGPGSGAVSPTPVGLEPGWYAVTVSGTISPSLNQAYGDFCAGMPQLNCRSTLPGAVTAAGIDNWFGQLGALRVHLTQSGSFSEGLDFVNVSRRVFWLAPGNTMSAERSGILGGVHFPDGGYIPEFRLGGGVQKLSFERIAPPLHVAESGTDADGTITWTASQDIQFLPGTFLWHFIPENPNGAAEMLGWCGGRTSCSYRPSVPGHIQVEASHNGIYNAVAIVCPSGGSPDQNGGCSSQGGGGCSATTTPGPMTVRLACEPPGPNLVVECNSNAGNGTETKLKGSSITVNRTRASEIQCSASAENATLRITRWEFTGGGAVVPSAAEPQHTDGEWHGIVVVEGDIRVRGILNEGLPNERPDVAEATVRIADRGWPVLVLPAPKVDVALGGSLTAYPNNAPMAALLGGDELGVMQLPFPVGIHNPRALPYDSIESGPNTGWVYFLSPLPMHQPQIYIHPALDPALPTLTPGTADYADAYYWQQDQDGAGSGTCTQAQIPAVRSEIERHEGVTMVAQSHWGRANAVLASTNLQTRYDRIVTRGGGLNLSQRAVAMYAKWEAQDYLPVQKAFEGTDYPQIVHNAHCHTDYSKTDGA
jgi:hypothetical protein